MKLKYLLYLNLLLIHYSTSAQTWSAPVQVIDPNSGSGGFSGNFSNLIVLSNGIPAMADNPGGAYGSGGYLRYLRASDPTGAGPWETVIVDAAIGTGKYLSLQIVNGIPAISYYDEINKDLKFVRATDPTGSHWASPISLDVTGDVGQYTSLQTFNSRAQISYYDETNGDLKYVRATLADASAWGTPVTVDATNNVGQYTSLCAINGIPSIAYYDVTNGDLKYAVSSDINGNPPWASGTLDANGNVGKYASLRQVNGHAAISYYNDQTSFFGLRGSLQYITPGGSPVVIDGGSAGIDVGQYTSLQIVGGNPAISYLDNYGRRLKYIRALDLAGSNWNTPPVIAANQGGFYSSLHVVNGKPAIAYHDQTNFDLKYVSATDANGSAPWATPVTFDVIGSAGGDISLQIVDGYPAVAFSNSARDYGTGSLLYVRATDATGSHWGTPVTVDASGYAGRDASMQIVDGKPAIAYVNQSGNIKYVIAKDPLGAGWETPIIVDAASGGGNTSLKIINTRPAISYSVYNYPNSPLKYIRANNASGFGPLSWGTAVTVDAVGGTYASLQVINGNPAISYYTFNNNYSNPAGVLKYKRSDDADGNGWTKPVVIVQSGGDVGLYNSLQMVDSRPAISYYDQTNQDLKFIQASDADGANWPPSPITIDATGDVGRATCLQIVDHVPVISYYDATNYTLKYVSGKDPSGAGWATPQTLASGGLGDFTSMIANGNEVMIAYENQELPYFISGSLSGPYFRTRQSGNWNDVISWETSPVADFASGVVSPSTTTPDFTSNTITVQSGHTITVAANVAADQIIVNSGGAIVVNNGSILSINDGVGFDITVNGSVTVQAGGNMIIRSTSAGTASVGSSTGTITGNVTVERYIPDNGHRALRLLTAATTGTQTIKDAWQEGGAAVNNLGTQITSPLFNGSNGFDANSPLASIYMFNQTASAGTAWTNQPVTNTNVKRLDSEPGYLLLVFGDRNASPSNSLHDASILRSTGSLRQGTQPAVVVSSTGGYTLTGNPYASPIDFETIAGTPNLAQYFYIFDANLSGRLNIGGFRLVERLSSNTYQYTPVLGSPVVDNTMRYINSGQAFLLATTGSNAGVVFTEGSKTALLPDLNVFRAQNGTEQQLLASLLVIAPDTTALADGIRVRFNNSYSATVTAEDVIKMSNITSENLASRRNSNLLIVEKRPEVTVNDTIYLDIANMGIKNYSFQFSSENMPANLVAALQDNFTGAQTDISLNSIINIDFSVTSDPASSAADRFKIVLRPAGPLPITFSSIKAFQQVNDIAVEWRVQNETGIKHYEVQKSADGRIFSIAEKQTAAGNNMSIVNYRWLDVNATTGDHFYRIRSIDLNGENKYSPIVKVTIGKGKAGYFVYPNPPIGDLINLQFTDQPKGTYNVRLMNTLGQVLLTKKISHMEGSSTETIQVNSIMQKGQYVLEVTAPDKSRKSFKTSY